MRRAPVLSVLALIAALALPACGGDEDGEDERPPARDTASAQEAADARFVAALRRGGHTIVFRHAKTDQSAYDRENGDYANCGLQRNLNVAGREQAREVGAALRRLRVPVGTVLASPYCRTKETARLAFGRVKLSRDLLPGEGLDPDDVRSVERRLLARLRRAPRAGTNTVFVTHNFAVETAAGAGVDEGGAAVFRPQPGGRGFRLVRTVPAPAWAAWAQRLG